MTRSAILLALVAACGCAGAQSHADVASGTPASEAPQPEADADAAEPQPAPPGPPSTAAPAEPGALTGAPWVMSELDGQPAPTGGEPPQLQLGPEDGRLAGYSGCNRVMGSFAVDGEALQFTGVAMTKRACMKGMALEQGFAEALHATRRFALDGDTLTLLGEDGRALMRLRREPAPH